MIGQVFTGHVEIQCPMTHPSGGAEAPRSDGSSSPLATALLTLAIWHAWLAIPEGGMNSGDHCLHAFYFLLAGVATKYATRSRLIPLLQRVLRWGRAHPPPEHPASGRCAHLDGHD